MPWSVALALGLVMGVLSGMGLGGGKLVVPLLVLGLGVHQQAAQAVSLLAFLPIALVGSWVHRRERRVELRVVARLAPMVLAGAAAGAWVAQRVDPGTLRRGYGLLLLAVAGYELWPSVRCLITPRIRPPGPPAQRG